MSNVIAPELENAVPHLPSNLKFGKGAQLYVYISPSNNTAKLVHHWEVTFTHEGSSWTGTITAKDPHQTLQTPGLSGKFKIKVIGQIGPKQVIGPLKPRPPSTDVIGCNQNCMSFVGIVADPGGLDATYWTTWDAVCSSS